MIKVSQRLIKIDYLAIEESLFEKFPFCSEKGGAIFSSAVDSCILKNCVFKQCSAVHGGAVAIEDAAVFLYSSCFSECRATSQDDDGGNAFLATRCTIVVHLSASFKCSPDNNTCGDAVFEVQSTEVHAAHINFSSCVGIYGECSFGSIQTNELSRVRYMNVAECREHSLHLLPGSILGYSNFLKNDPYSFLFNGNRGKMRVEHCFIFGNTPQSDYSFEDMKNSVEYFECVGDIDREGVTYQTSTETYLQSDIMIEECINGICINSGQRRYSSKCILVGVCMSVANGSIEF